MPLLGDIRQTWQKLSSEGEQWGCLSRYWARRGLRTRCVGVPEKLWTVRRQSRLARTACLWAPLNRSVCNESSHLWSEFRDVGSDFGCKYISLQSLFIISNPINGAPLDLDMILRWHLQLYTFKAELIIYLLRALFLSLMHGFVSAPFPGAQGGAYPDSPRSSHIGLTIKSCR